MLVATRTRQKERGFTLVVSALIMVALMGLGISAVWLSTMGMNTARNLNGRQQAMNAAQAGIHHARAVLLALGTSNPNDWTPALKGNNTQTLNDPVDPTHLKNKGMIVYDGTRELVNYGFHADPDPNAPALGTYTVWIRNDPTELMAAGTDTNKLTTESNGAVIIRSLGRDSTGQFEVMIKASVLQCVAAGVFDDPGVFGKGYNQFNNNQVTAGIRFN